ncbi:MAG: Gfo/Idh/MocA family oxidoreductase [Gammaproteobacteria bacterium]|nr:Gfo/Idh/MocA family oxidoreductase [Gammaproteobacteria bacterium]
MKPVRWGVLGAANFALQQMAPAIHEATGASLAALGTSSADKAAPFQAFCPDLRVYTDYDALLAADDIDAVYIPLPNHLHVAWTKKALLAGKHVLTEKPVAMQASEIDELIALRDKTGLLAAEAYMIVHHPQWIRAKELYQTGAIGNLLQVDGVFSYNNVDPENVRNKPETGGGGIRDIGVYTYGATRFVTGAEPKSLDARLRYESGVDVVAEVSADFGNFRHRSVVSTRMFPRQHMTFHGDEGFFTLSAPFNAGVYGQAQIEIHQPELAVRIERFPAVRQYRLQVENFCHSVQTGAPYPCPLEFSRGTQEMIDMVFAAGGSGQQA